MKCRGCGAGAQEFKDLIDLGEQAIIKFKNNPDEKDDYARLNLIKCDSCHLVQLENSVNPDRMFRDYHYLSGVNSSMRASLLDIIKHAESLIDLQPNDRVID